MGDYIDRDELLKKQYNASRSNEPQLAEMAVDVQDIEDAPAADVAPVVHGRWNKKGNETKCSLCKFIYYSNKDIWNYCPNCGAKMDGEAREDAT